MVRSHGSLWARCKVYIVLKNNQLSKQYKRTIRSHDGHKKLTYKTKSIYARELLV